MNLRVLVLSPYPLAGASPRYRLYAFREPLRERGVHLDIKPFLTSRAFALRMNGARNHPLVLAQVAVAAVERLQQARSARTRYDLIYVHRQSAPILHHHFDQAFLRSGLPIVFDMDDAVFNEYSINQLLRGSAAATVGNDYLGDYVRRTSPSTQVVRIPTVIDTSEYTIRPEQLQAARPVVGWIGTSSTFNRYLWPVLPGLLDVCRQFGAEFRVIASLDVREETETMGATFVPWSLESELTELRRFDIGVMPLSDDQFVRGKCAFKLIQYGAVGIPSVGSDIGANGEVIRHGMTGLLAADPAAFRASLTELLSRADLGRPLGLAARRIIEEQFSLASQVSVMEQVLREAAGSTR